MGICDGMVNRQDLPRYLYHGTFSVLLPSILSQGLMRMPTNRRIWSVSNPARVYLTDNRLRAKEWVALVQNYEIYRLERNPGEPVVLSIETDWLDLNLLRLDFEARSGKDYVYAADIPPEAISVV